MAVVSLRPSSKGVTALMIVSAVVLFGLVLFYMAAAGRLKNETNEMARKEKEVSASKEIAQKLEKSKLEYLDARSQVRCLESSVSTQDYVPTLLRQIEHLGKSVNLKVLGVRPQPAAPTPVAAKPAAGGATASGTGAAAAQPGVDGAQPKKAPPPYDELKIDLAAEGKYMNVLDFLYKLTSFPKILAVNNVEMSPAKCTQYASSPDLDIKLNVTAFILKTDTPKAPPPVPNSPAASRGAVMIKGGANASG